MLQEKDKMRFSQIHQGFQKILTQRQHNSLPNYFFVVIIKA